MGISQFSGPIFTHSLDAHLTFSILIPITLRSPEIPHFLMAVSHQSSTGRICWGHSAQRTRPDPHPSTASGGQWGVPQTPERCLCKEVNPLRLSCNSEQVCVKKKKLKIELTFISPLSSALNISTHGRTVFPCSTRSP